MSKTAEDHKAMAPQSLNFAVVICSSSRHKGLKLGKNVHDPSGDFIVETLRQHGHTVTSRAVVPDDRHFIQEQVRKALDANDVDAIITCGGTGINPTDVTIETIHPFLEKEIQGFGELFRALSYEKIGSAAILTRALAGVSKGKAIFCIPGSPNAVSLCLEKLILPEAGHVIKHARES
jgi:molybdenum cofactor biosynthesis protein B